MNNALVDGIPVDDYYIVPDFCKPLLDSDEVVVGVDCIAGVFHNCLVDAPYDLVDAPYDLVVDLLDPVGNGREVVVALYTFTETARPLALQCGRGL